MRREDAMGETGPSHAVLNGLVPGSFVALVVVVFLALLAVFGRSGGNSDDYRYAIRIRTSVMRLAVILLAAVLMIALHALLKETKLGKAMWASSANLDLAKVTGINTGRVVMATWIIAGVTVGMLFHNIVPSMGFSSCCRCSPS